MEKALNDFTRLYSLSKTFIYIPESELIKMILDVLLAENVYEK